MKIGIFGAQGTGKTTLAFKLAHELKAADPSKCVTIISEVVRRCPLPVNTSTTPEAQMWIFNHQMAAEIEAAAKNDIVICDRTLIDNLAYFKHALRDDYYGNHIRRMFDHLFEIALMWLETYDTLYFLRPKEPIVGDGVRSADRRFQMDIDDILSEWAYNFQIGAETP